tara:strand:- start:15179 stop:16921 length:1743 start_codon:yes stop_codon:yes gene_type:complete
MCGIGFVYSEKLDPIKLSLIARHELTNRGPSWTVEKYSDKIFLHQSVLSIQTENSNIDKTLNKIDLDKESQFTLYNGEIYEGIEFDKTNDFKTLNDIKKIEKLESFLKNVDGMFSLIRVNIESKNIHINAFRDVIGEKRIYYYCNKKERILIIASTASFIFKVLKAFQLDININHNSLLDYFQKRHYVNNFTSIKGIQLLNNGSKLTFNSFNFEIKITKYDSLLKFYDNDLYQSIKNLKTFEYSLLIENSIKNDLLAMNNVNKKEVSQSFVFSGGIDSSLIAALSYKSKKIRIDNLFTLTFGDKDSVSINAPKLIKNWKVPHIIHDVYLEEYLYALNRCIELQAAPVSTHSLPSSYILAQLCSNFSKNLSSILVGGEGADELFLGYPYYLNSLLSNKVSGALYSDNVRGNKDTFEKSYIDINEENFVNNFYLDNGENNISGSIRRNAFCDYKYQLPNVGLAAADVVSSDLGIEFRTPFTRFSTVKIAFNSPTNKLLDIKKQKSKFPLQNLFEKEFNEVPLRKSGFAGFPNEIENILDIKNDINEIDKFLQNYFGFVKEDRDTRWKKINMAIFCNIHDLRF